MSKTLKEQALEAQGEQTFRVLITTNKGSQEWTLTTQNLFLDIMTLERQHPEGCTWDVLEFGKNIT